jgi:hypothetical protein
MLRLEDVKEDLGVTVGDFDGAIQRHIDRATATLGREIGRWLGQPEPMQETFDGGREVVILQNDPINPAAVVVETHEHDGWRELSSDNYRLTGRVVQHAFRFPVGQVNVRVSYTSGFLPGMGPMELQDLVHELVIRRIRSAGKEHITQETLGDYSYSRGDVERTRAWRDVARRWRRRVRV